MAAIAHMEEPMLSRLNRLDNILKQLEEIRESNYNSPKSSYASTASSGGGMIWMDADADFSEQSLEKHCRPVDEVMMEVQNKGTLIDRLLHAEDRILKLCLQMEEEIEMEKSRASEEKKSHSSHLHLHSPKKALSKLVKSCVVGKGSSKKMAKT